MNRERSEGGAAEREGGRERGGGGKEGGNGRRVGEWGRLKEREGGERGGKREREREI